MQVSLSKWGKSIGLKIPNSILRELNLDSSSNVDIRVENGKIIIEPIGNAKLNVLLGATTDGNLHDEISCGVAIGKENIT